MFAPGAPGAPGRDGTTESLNGAPGTPAVGGDICIYGGRPFLSGLRYSCEARAGRFGNPD